jgi:hypothetical protein
MDGPRGRRPQSDRHRLGFLVRRSVGALILVSGPARRPGPLGLGSTQPSWSRMPSRPACAWRCAATSGKAKSCVIDGGNQCAIKTRKWDSRADPVTGRETGSTRLRVEIATTSGNQRPMSRVDPVACKGPSRPACAWARGAIHVRKLAKKSPARSGAELHEVGAERGYLNV